MSFPLYFLIFPLLLFLFIYLVFILINIYHLVIFSEMSLTSFFMTFIFLAGVAYLLFWTWQLAQPLDWQQPISIFKNLSFEMNL